MSRFTGEKGEHIRTSEKEPSARQHYNAIRQRVARGETSVPNLTPEEVDTEAERRASPRGRRVRPKPLRFFPHLFPVPTELYGVITVVGATLMVAVLFYGVREILSPLLLAIVAGVLFYPFRREPKLRPIMVAGAIVLGTWFISQAMGLILPGIIAFLLAYSIEPLVTKLQRKFYIKRWILALGFTLAFVAVVAIAVVYMAPLLIEQVGSAIGSIDSVSNNLVAWARGGALADLIDIPPDKAAEIVDQHLAPKLAGLQRMLLEGAGDVGNALPGILEGLMNFAMIPFVMFYFIKDYWHIRASIYSFIPREYQRRSQHFLKDLDEVVGGYLRGDVMTSILQGIFIGVGLHFIGVPNALLLGVLTGFLSLVPMIGGIIAYLLAAATSLTTADPLVTFAWVTGLFVVQSILETTIITPQVMGRHTDMHPLLVIGSLLVFGLFMGIGGMLIAIPVTGLILRYAIRWRERRQARLEREKVLADLKENPHHAGKAPAAKLDEPTQEVHEEEEVKVETKTE